MGRGADRNEELFYGDDLESIHLAEDAELEDSAKHRLESLAEAMRKNQSGWEDSFPLTIAFSKLVHIEDSDCAINVSIELDENEDWSLTSSCILASKGNVSEEMLYQGKDLLLALEAANQKSKEISSLQEDPTKECFSWSIEEALLSIDGATEEELEDAEG